jgi:Putative DNA-binding domain
LDVKKMREVREWDETDLERIIMSDQKETTTLDYKDSAALKFKDQAKRSDGKGTLGEKHRQDLIRDVASMANAEGGTIIYGIAERSGGYPDHIDDGVDPATVSAEQIEQIILNNINPRVEGFFVHRIDLTSKRQGMCTFVISIQKAQKNAPHQSDDKVYYRRHDATKLKMEDNAIRDAIGRSLEFGKKFGGAWDLLVEIRRIVADAEGRSRISKTNYFPRQQLVIPVSPSLRSSGAVIMSLPRSLREEAANLIGNIDIYNSEIETVDPGQHDRARLTDALINLLRNIADGGSKIHGGLLEVLQDQP